jgi:cytosine/adenosine deaminase-related metal-dependent hydrolase
MILKNVKIYGESEALNIFVDGSTISHISNSNDENISNTNELQLHFENVIAFPGLINSHDHLEFNLYPQFGNRFYNNYAEWGKYVLGNYEEEIERISRIPLLLRVSWGLYKNLLCGVTTVVHHGEKIAIDENIIDVFQNYHFLHSVGFEKNWKYKLNKFSSKKPFVIHIGEGEDEYAQKEIDKLIRWNLFKKEIIGVHGVAMTAQQAKSFEALVWCPASNFFMLDKTAEVDKLKKYTQIIFGTDSTLTANWNLWNHLRLAKKKSSVSDKELFDMLTAKPASVWNLEKKGAIEENYVADIVVAQYNNAAQNFFDLNPENILLVLREGEIKLFDEKLLEQLQRKNFSIDSFSRISINDTCKYVYGNLPELITEIKKYNSEVFFPVQINN